jgi:hypothetical protein
VLLASWPKKSVPMPLHEHLLATASPFSLHSRELLVSLASLVHLAHWSPFAIGTAKKEVPMGFQERDHSVNIKFAFQA